MKQVFLNLLEELKEYQRPHELQPAATPEAVALLTKRATEELRYSLPVFYLELLQTTDGVARNGIQVYGTQTQRIQGLARESYIEGLVEANLVWRDFELNKDYIFFAESGSDLYQHNLQTNLFEVADRVGRTVFDTFATAEELFEKVFNHMLDRYSDKG